ncbi:hypothetical protein L226DRAFT_573430 [Lentinus tigrinus ALCF2SS1-7]|uniref:Plant heme peroxidase family profile domain-containing protein n=1 Tax=Lentinus tigrinus ALCF2SS1-6 TaxID=1328759 RepID=A0A5C2S3E1_9APHY|nr:hypothetical protein L227DRAFT_578003 [Lentinus tigrinus ALCF2SS1-6]RPD72071.1 hypothetical protein L226DRAFT_573430 [Lentinus tigrinus ALCF2SS1-7]
MLGRKDATRAVPDGLVPEPFHTVNNIIVDMLDFGCQDIEVVWSLSAHTVAAASRGRPGGRPHPALALRLEPGNL